MRRANGTGSIVKLGGKRRKPFGVRVSYQDEHNHIQQKYLSYHVTAREAQDALDKYNSNKAQGAAPSPDKLSISVQEIYRLWSARKYATAGSSSVMSYKASWTRLAPLYGLKMRDVSLDSLQAIIDADERAGLSKSSINNDKILMKALFRFAMERDIVTKDYSEFIQLPQVGAKYEKGAFTDLQVKKLETMAAGGDQWAGTVLILCYTGFRITEFLTLTRFSYHADGNYLQGGLKTEAGKDRIVPVHPKIKPYLNYWLKQNADTIICDARGKAIRSNTYRAGPFAEVMRKLGVPQATPHWCRHTFASRLHAVGVPELELKRLMGHAGEDVTQRYTHTNIAQLTNAILMLA